MTKNDAIPAIIEALQDVAAQLYIDAAKTTKEAHDDLIDAEYARILTGIAERDKSIAAAFYALVDKLDQDRTPDQSTAGDGM